MLCSESEVPNNFIDYCEANYVKGGEEFKRGQYVSFYKKQ